MRLQRILAHERALQHVLQDGRALAKASARGAQALYHDAREVAREVDELQVEPRHGVRHLEHVEAAHLEPVVVDDGRHGAVLLARALGQHGVARAARGADDAVVAQTALHLGRDVARLQHGAHVVRGGQRACRRQDLVLRVRYDDRVLEHRGRPLGKLPHVVGLQEAVEQLVAPRAQLAAALHEAQKRAAELNRRKVAPAVHDARLARRGRILAHGVPFPALRVHKEKALVMARRALLGQVRAGPQADDALRALACAPLGGNDHVPSQLSVVRHVKAPYGQLAQHRSQLHAPRPSRRCTRAQV